MILISRLKKNPFLKFNALQLCFVLLLSVFAIQGQTPGMIIEPATGSGAMVLDPNNDGYISSSNI